MDSYVLIVFCCFVSAIIGSELGHRLKKVDRSLYAKLAVHLLSAFAASILLLILLSEIHQYLYIISIVLGLWYGYFMAKAKAFEMIK